MLSNRNHSRRIATLLVGRHSDKSGQIVPPPKKNVAQALTSIKISNEVIKKVQRQSNDKASHEQKIYSLTVKIIHIACSLPTSERHPEKPEQLLTRKKLKNKQMKKSTKLFLLITVMVFSLKTSMAQNTLGKTDDLNRISITPIVADQSDELPAAAYSLLETKLQQIVTRNGLGANSLNPRFIITVNLNIITKDVVPGSPTRIAMNIDATFYIADYHTKTVFSTKTISFMSIGINANKAYIDGIKSIKPESSEFTAFIEEGKNKIIAYYNDRCDFILQDAKTLAAQKKYLEAIYQLSLVPDVCKDCYMKASVAVLPLYQAYMDDLCNKNLARANSVWAANPNSYGADEVSTLLSEILPDAKCYNDSQNLITEIKKKVLLDEKRDWNFQMKQWNDNISIESQRIKAYRDVGVAYGNHQPNTIYHIRGWLW